MLQPCACGCACMCMCTRPAPALSVTAPPSALAVGGAHPGTWRARLDPCASFALPPGARGGHERHARTPRREERSRTRFCDLETRCPPRRSESPQQMSSVGRFRVVRSDTSCDTARIRRPCHMCLCAWLDGDATQRTCERRDAHAMVDNDRVPKSGFRAPSTKVGGKLPG